MRNVVVLGATGHFGGRICRRLLRMDDVRLFVSSRSLPSAERFARVLKEQAPQSTISPVQLDQNADLFSASLGKLNPEIVVHAVGPYQAQDYVVAEACIANRCHYIDLADGREFVENFSSLNAAASAAGVLLVSGASTLPGLSSTVVASFQNQFESITEIVTSIAPAHQTPRGSSTISAVMSYCGKPFKVLEHHEWRTRYGWQDLRAVRYPQLGRRIAAACDVPDLALFPKLYPELETATFHAALEAPWEQLSLWLMAAIARAGVVKDWSRFESLFETISTRLLRLGSASGGMAIRISGTGRNGERLSVLWNLLAHNNHGPEIPCTPAIVLVRKILQDRLEIRGAIPCIAAFTLAEFSEALEGYDVSWSHQVSQRIQ